MVQHLNWKLKQNLLVPAPFAVVGAVDIASPFIDVHPVARGDLDLCGFPFFLLYTVKVFWFLFFSYIVKFADERSWGSQLLFGLREGIFLWQPYKSVHALFDHSLEVLE